MKRDNWMLVVAIAILAAWAIRVIFWGPGIGMSLWMTSAGLVLVGVLLWSWYGSRRRRRG
jgi:hypothetical protein